MAVTILLVRLLVLMKYQKINSNSQMKYASDIIPSGSKIQITPSPSIILNDDYPASTSGYAISWPQCGKRYPTAPYDFGIIGVTGGYSFNYNPCLHSEYKWAKNAKYEPSFYINLDYPIPISKSLIQSFNCGVNDEECIAYNYGYETGKKAYEYALSQQAISNIWWLDVQIVSRWSKNKMINSQVVLGAVNFFKDNNLKVGLSTTPYQWNTVVGDLKTNLPNWIPGMLNKSKAAQYCLDGTSYSDGYVKQLAYIDNGFEAVYVCRK